MPLPVRVGSGNSAVATATFTITLPAATPVFGPPAGTYNAVQMVTLSDTTTGSTIYYTTDGSTPSTSSTVYTGPVTVSSSETIQAIATASGYVTSAVGTAAYTISLPTFGLAVNPGSMTIAASGGEGLANITVTPLNTFQAAVTFSCSGLPKGASCVFTPSSVTPNGTYPVTTVLAITSTGTAAALKRGPSPFLPGAIAFAACIIGWRKRRRLSFLAVLFVSTLSLTLLSGCSGTTQSSPSATTTQVTITATSGTLVQTGTLTLTVE